MSTPNEQTLDYGVWLWSDTEGWKLTAVFESASDAMQVAPWFCRRSHVKTAMGTIASAESGPEEHLVIYTPTDTDPVASQPPEVPQGVMEAKIRAWAAKFMPS